jgi:hypothetical protein
MAVGQIDPARLEGDALRRWYLRSPADIEQDRQRAAAQRYRDFFGNSGTDNPDQGLDPGSQLDGQGTDAGSNRDFEASIDNARSGFTWPARRLRLTSAPPSDYFLQVAGATPADFWDDWTPCTSGQCHRNQWPPRPQSPPIGTSPRPPAYSPRVGGSNGNGGSPKRRLPQCDENDTERCSELPNPDARARCWASASERRAYCLSHDGEVGWPKLQTR